MKTCKKGEATAQKWARYRLTIDSVKDLLVANRGLLQAAGSWSVDACCAAPGNDCDRGNGWCWDRASSSDWLFGLWPDPPQRFEPTGTDTVYQRVLSGSWPKWGWDGISYGDLDIGWTSSGAPGGSHGYCDQGGTYRGTVGEICGGDHNWWATDVEAWYPI